MKSIGKLMGGTIIGTTIKALAIVKSHLHPLMYS